MKRKNLWISVLTTVLCVLLFASCSNNIMDDATEVKDNVVWATFDETNSRGSVESTYTQTVTLKEISEVYWTYTAKKADKAGQTGTKTDQTAVKSTFAKGLDGAIGPFSQGLWDFEVFGYTNGTDCTNHATNKVLVSGTENESNAKYYSGLIYKGTVSNVELKNGTQSKPDPINVIINLLTEGTGTFAVSNASDFAWQEDSGSGYTGLYLTMLAASGDDTVSKAVELEYNATDDCYYFKKTDGNWSELSWNFVAGSWNMVFSIVKAEADATAPTYSTYKKEWSGVKYTFTTSQELLVKVYVGQTTTLEAKIIESNLAWAEFNGTVESIKSSTVTSTVESNTDTTLTSSVTPATASSETIDTSETRKTTVTIPSTASAFTEGATASLTVTATPLLTANSLFKITANTGAVGAIDLKATVTTTADDTQDTKEVSSFTDSQGKVVEVTVETYIAQGMSEVTLTYSNGTTTETWKEGATSSTEGLTVPSGDTAGVCYYNSGTGQFVYKTTHFSTFLVGAKEVAYVKSNNTAYKTLQEAMNVAANDDTITLLRNVDNGTGIKSPDGGEITDFVDKTKLTIDFNGYTYSVIGPAVGSSGTESQAMHWGKGRLKSIDLKNGKFVITQEAKEKVKIAVQNYIALTAENMVFDFTNIKVDTYWEDTYKNYDCYNIEVPMFCTNDNSSMSFEECTILLPEDSNKGVVLSDSTGDGSIMLSNTTVDGYVCIESVGKSIEVKDSTAMKGNQVYSYYPEEKGYFIEESTKDDSKIYILYSKKDLNAKNTTTGKCYCSLENALNNASANETIQLQQDVVVSATVKVTRGNSDPITLDLNGKTISNTTDIFTTGAWSLISVRGKTNLTITGNGTLKAKENDCYAADTYNKEAVLTIKNGTYIGNLTVLYSYPGTINIEGGDFSILQKYNVQGKEYDFLLNCKDAPAKAGNAKIIVSGGSFHGFDPSNNAAEGEGTSYLATGYTVTNSADGSNPTVYTVVAETST